MLDNPDIKIKKKINWNIISQRKHPGSFAWTCHFQTGNWFQIPEFPVSAPDNDLQDICLQALLKYPDTL